MKIVKMTVLFFLVLFSCNLTGANSYSILQNGSSYDLYINSDDAGELYEIYPVQNTSDDNSSAVFEKIYEDDWSSQLPVIESDVIPRASAPITTPTADGSGQVVHPSVLYFADGWNGYKYYMGVTGYYQSNAQYENPHLLASNDKVNWVAAPGVINPLEDVPPGYSGFHQDPNLLYNEESDEIWYYYCTVNTTEGISYFKLRKYDGVTVSDAIICSRPSMTVAEVSWSVIKKDGIYHYIADRTGATPCYRSSEDGVNFSAPSVVTTLNDPGLNWYHMDVQYIDFYDKWLGMIYTGSYQTFFEADAPSGPYTLLRAPIMMSNPNNGKWDGNFYKSCFVYDTETDKLNIWYTGIDRTKNNESYCGYTEYSYSDLLDYFYNATFINVYGFGATNTSLSDGIFSVENTGGRIGTLNGKIGKTVITRAALQNSGGFASQNTYSALATNVNSVGITNSVSYANFLGFMGNGSAVNNKFGVIKNTNYHTFCFNNAGVYSIDGNTFINNQYGTQPTGSYGMWLINPGSYDYIASTNKNITTVQASSIETFGDRKLFTSTNQNEIIKIVGLNITHDSKFRTGKYAHLDTMYYGDSIQYKILPTGIVMSRDPVDDDIQIPLTISTGTSAVNVTISSWNSTDKKWVESSETENEETTHVIGGLAENNPISIYRDGNYYDTAISNETGYITWVYDGGFSEHEFSILSGSDFTVSTTTGSAPYSVKFSNTSNATSYAWDFENDGIIDSTKQNPVHTYGKAGNYTVNLTVQNEFGNFSTVKTDYITVSAPGFASDATAWFNWVFSYLRSMFVGMWLSV